jgi:hypothetical protein
MKLIARFVQKYLALWAQGFAGHVGIAKETTFGTPVAATDYFEILSENIALSIDRFPIRNVSGGFHEPKDYAGARRIAGDLTMFGHPVSIGILLKAAFNTNSVTSISATLARTNFSTTKSEFASTVALQPYTIEVYRDVTSSVQYRGMLLDRLNLSLAPNQDLRCSASWIGRSQTVIARTTPTFPGSPSDPFAWDSASLSIDGAASARWEQFNMEVRNNLNPILSLDASNIISKVRRSDLQMIRVTGTLDFEDIDEYLDFVNQTERQIKLNLFRANSFNLLIDMPRFVYTAVPMGLAGRDRLTLAVEGTAFYNTGSGLAVNLGLTTTKSNY